MSRAEMLFAIFTVSLSMIFVCFVCQAIAGVELDTTSGSFLKIGVGARPAAMGEAYVAMAGDVNSIYWNPAALSGVRNSQISLTHTEWFAGVRYEWIGLAQPLGRWLTVGGNASLLHSGEIPRTLESESSIGGYETDGVFRFANSSYGIAVGSGVYRNMRFGVAVQVLGQSISYSEVKRTEAADLTSQSVVVSLGSLYQTPMPDLQLGASLQNLGSNGASFSGGESSPIPTRLKLGAAYTIQVGSIEEAEEKEFEEGGKVKKVETGALENRLVLLLDLSIASNTSPRLHLGSEYSLKGGIALRGGYKSGTGLDFLSRFSGGLGYKSDAYKIDYAFVPFGEIGSTHRVSFTLQF